MKIIQKGDSYADYNKDVSMYMMGLSFEYRFSDIYRSDSLVADLLVGSNMQNSKITQDGSIDLDAETLYGVNAGIEIIF